MAVKRYRYCVSNITQNGEECKNPTYQWDIPACASNPCDEGNCIEVELDLDENPDCRSISVTIDCDDCAKCPPVKKIVTFCDSNEDCESCALCEDNVCVYQCDEDEFCDDGDCVDCLADEDCPYNKVCTAGECLCPPGLVEDIYGNCVECINDGQCDACEKCVGGECEPKCPSNLCNDGECKECLVDGDCSGANVCCGPDDTCECCPGYRWDAGTDTCVPVTECISNSDCGDCEYCNAGVCLPITCPSGYVVSNIKGNCCVKECDCSAPDCDGDSLCIPLDSSTCYCNECTGSCDENSDCGEGCYCKDGQCVTNPCYGSCSDAGDCGEGCGCLDGECVPCSSGDCADNSCAEIKGCECDGGDCEGSNCKGGCTFDECGEGCGCQDNNCVSCESVACVDNDDCPYGCACNDGICRDSGCDEVVCNTPADCGHGCGCDGGTCRPCDTYSCAECGTVAGCVCENGLCQDDDDDTCQDVLNIEKDSDSCDVVLSLETDSCCSCGDLVIRSLFTNVSNVGSDASFDVQFSLFKNGVAIASTGVENELDLFAANLPSVVISSNYVYKEAEDFGSGYVIKAGAPALYGSTDLTVPFTSNGTTAVTGGTVKKVDDVFSASGKSYKVIKSYLTIELDSGDVVITGDSCEYDLFETKIYETTSTFNPASSYNTDMVPQTLCATPRFTFTKSTSSTFPAGAGTTSKQYYADPDNDGDGVWEYRLEDYTTDELENFRYYKLSSNCSCADEFKYGCNGAGVVADRLVFCAIKSLGEVTFDDCASEVTFEDGVFIDCDVADQSPTQPVFDLYINGEIHTANISPTSGEIIAASTSYVTTNGQITSVELVMKNTTCEECRLEETNVPVLDPCDATCYNVSALSVDNIDDTDACTTGTEITVSGGFGTIRGDLYTGTYLTPPPTSVEPFDTDINLAALQNLEDGDYTVVIYDELGCKALDTFSISGCCDLAVSGVSASCTSNDAEFDLAITVAGSSTYSLKVVNNTTGSVTVLEASDTPANINSGSPYTVSSAPNGNYTVLVEDTGSGAIAACTFSQVLGVNCCLDAFTAVWNPVTGEVDLEKGGVAYTGQVDIYHNASLVYSGLASLINHGALWQEGESYTIDFTDSSGCVGSALVNITPCSVTSTSPTVSCDVDSYTFTFSSIGGSNSGAFDFEASDGTISTAAPVSMTDLGGGSFEVVLNIGAEIPSEFVSTPISYTITDSVDSSCQKMGTVARPTDCAGDVVVSYNCTDGIVITEGGSPYSGNIIIDGGSPIAYAANIYLTDGNHTVKVGGTTFPVNGINCCSTLSVSADAAGCDGTGIYVDWTVGGGSGSYNVTFKDNLGNTVGAAESGVSAGSDTKYLSGVANGSTVVIEATDANYNYVHGIGAPDDCVDSDSIVLNVCTDPGLTVNSIGCDGTLEKLQLDVDVNDCGITTIDEVEYGTPDVILGTPDPDDVSNWYPTTLSGGYYLANLAYYTPCSCGGVYSNSWSVPNGLLIKVTYTQGTCGTRTEYIHIPANAGPLGCEYCLGFNCEV